MFCVEGVAEAPAAEGEEAGERGSLPPSPSCFLLFSGVSAGIR